MNIQQFHYVLAVVDSKNFELAARKCFVTQSTLSTMIQKFEKEIAVKIFNRKTKPVSTTREGRLIIERLRIIVNEIDLLGNVVQEIKGELEGDISIGVIPTIAPYLLPLIINEYAAHFPKVNIAIKELNTEQIKNQLIQRALDVGILALPLAHKELVEIPLYKEPFLIYDCTGAKKAKKQSPKHLDYSKLCLLEDGHCLRTQVYDICKLSKEYIDTNVNYRFESGSMESLLGITRIRKGITILPYLTTKSFTKAASKNVVEFSDPVPVREIGILTHHYFAKKALLDALKDEIIKAVTPLLPRTKEAMVIKPI